MKAEKRERRENREQDNDTAVCVCNVCGRIRQSAIGLYSDDLRREFPGKYWENIND